MTAYKAVKSSKHKIKNPVKKKRLSIQLDKRLYNWKKGSLYLTALSGKRIICKITVYPKLAEMMKRYPMGDPNIYQDDDGNIVVGLAFKIPAPIITGTRVLGVDLGMRRLAATSDGKFIKGNEFNRHKRRIRFNKRSLQSRGTKSARKHLRKVRRKEANFSDSYTHLVANEILRTDADIIVIEDLAGLKEKKGFENKNAISQVPFYKLRLMLEYKAVSSGKKVVCVSPYNTSKMDHREGKSPGVRKGCRYYTVDGKVFDADVQAAINIAGKYKSKLTVNHPDSFNPPSPVDGSFKPTGQALVSEPNVFIRKDRGNVCKSQDSLLGIISP